MVSTWSPSEGSIPPPPLEADVDAAPVADDDGDDLLGPVGWHHDPWQRHQLRFFDGELWTEHVADGGIASVDSSPVAKLARSRPRPSRRSPSTDFGGPRVVADAPDPGVAGDPYAALRDPVLLIDEAPDQQGVRRLTRTDDSPAGEIVTGRPSLLTRWGRMLVAAPTESASRVAVRNAGGEVVLRLRRPGRRTKSAVDIVGPSGPIGRVTAERVRNGVHGTVLTSDGFEIARIDQRDGPAGGLRVTDGAGAVVARLTPVWDIPGSRHHLPPGRLLLDRRHIDAPWMSGSIFPSTPSRATGPGVDAMGEPAVDWLLLGAVLAPALLVPPPAPAP